MKVSCNLRLFYQNLLMDFSAPYKFCLIFLFFYLSIFNANTQKQGNIWYFGGEFGNLNYGVGINFNSGSPSYLTNSAMVFTNGCATYCNSNGELLFYSNGEVVYDRTHNIMLNGDNLGGNKLTPQSVIIVPFSDDTNRYYIVTNDGIHQGKGLFYSIIDMSLNNGFGAVINPKAINIYKNTNYQLSGCNHENGKDYWVIATIGDSNQLAAFQFTNSDVKPPIISDLGFNSNSASLLEISPSGNKIALKAKKDVHFNRYIIDFNSRNGIFSNPISINFDSLFNQEFNVACSFSPNGKLFYDIEVIGNEQFREYRLNQYNLDTTNISASKINIDIVNHFTIHDMQIGPNGKIYLGGGNDNSKYLDCITNPNNRGQSCGYQIYDIYLGGRYPGVILPNELLISKRPTPINSVTKELLPSINYNPLFKSLSVIYKGNLNCLLQIYDYTGQQIIRMGIKDNTLINFDSFSLGIYVYSINLNNRILTSGKFIIY